MADKKTDIVNNPAAPEVYADRVASVSVRGALARISFASERSGGDPKAPEAVVSGHVAMPIRGFLQLYAQMQSVVNQMEESGMLKTAAPAPKTAAAPKKKAAAKKKTASSKSKK
ncbi:MAG: hypothetical protein JJ900_15995 [Rhodospirillales bacterium]|nr:hypothetical protein [Rhodospirillales bacterium]MBO6788350.1 hypothetical protein [Rhodospirillales bacterium]